MRFIGITGGVGAGKSAILDYLRTLPDTRVMLTDEIAHDLMEPGTACFTQLHSMWEKEDIWQADGSFDRGKLAHFIFTDESKRNTLNAVVHPAVKEYVKEAYRQELAKGTLSLLVVEAALLIEEHYDEICDEIWYIYTSETNRRARLKETRGYSDEKITGIFASQLSEQEYREHCKQVIDNNTSLENTYLQIDKALGRIANE